LDSLLDTAADATMVAYHDEEWGIPIYDDKYVLPIVFSPFFISLIFFKSYQ
jgi:3-methyladenine DNA glycosylase Tag